MDRIYLLSLINMMVNLSINEQKELEKLGYDELEERYKLYLLEKTDEML